MTKIITICGSSKFVDIMAVCGWLLERDEGAIVLSLHLLPKWYTGLADHLGEAQGVADKMDALHLKKIDLAAEIFVVNYRGYIGDSTRAEIEYAEKKGKTFRWIHDDPLGLEVLKLLKV